MTTKRDASATGDHGEHGRARRARLRRPRGWAVLAAVAVAASSAAGVMILEAGTVLAPEPVVTTQTLTNGATTEVISVNTPPPTGYWVWPDGIARPYIKWYPEFVYAPWLPAGTPCSVVILPVDQVATNVIIAYGNYKRCG